MSAPAYGNRSVATHRAASQLIAAYLDSQGIDATARRPVGKLSEVARDALQPDVALPGTFAVVSTRTHPRFWDSLSAAQRGAALAGLPRGVVVHWRSTEPVGQSLVVISLDDFAAMIRT